MQIKLDRIKEKLAKGKEWWETLAAREKKALLIGGTCTLIFLVYALWWSPLNTSNANTRKRILSQQKTLIWMQAADQTLTKLQSQTTSQAPTSPAVMLTTLQKQLSHAGLQSQVTQLKQANQHAIELHLQKVEFDKLIQFLITISKTNHLSIDRFNATADTNPGLVNADIVIG